MTNVTQRYLKIYLDEDSRLIVVHPDNIYQDNALSITNIQNAGKIPSRLEIFVVIVSRLLFR